MKKLAFLLAFIIAVTAVMPACSDTSNNGGENEKTAEVTTVGEAESTAETEETTLACSVPEGVDLDGQTVRILSFSDTNSFNVSVQETSGEILNDAVFTANQEVMEKLNCTFEYIDNGGIEPDKIKNANTAGDDIYDIIYGTQWKVAPLVVQHMFANLNESADVYIDREQPWWYDAYISEAETDDTHTFFLAGDISPDIFRRSSMMILNVDLLTDIGGSVSDIYSKILDGTWTYDAMSELVSQVYVDANGNGSRDQNDVFGFASWTRSDVDHFMIDAGVRTFSRDDAGVPYATFNSERTVKFVEELVNFLWNNNGSYYVEQIPTFEMLSENRVMLLCEKFSRLDLIRDSATNFTIIPLPKLDETIDSYSSLVHDDALVICVPVLDDNTKETSAVIEMMSYKYYYDVMPNYYDIILKTKYRRDSSDEASQIIDVIHGSFTTDFGYIYNYALGSLVTDMRTLIGVDKSTDFASYYTKREKAFNKLLDKLITAMSADE